MKISREDVQKIASLARLNLSDEEIAGYQTDLSGILTYIKQLNEVETKSVVPTAQVTDHTNVLADDDVKNEPRTKELLKNAPETEGDSIKVKAVFDE